MLSATVTEYLAILRCPVTGDSLTVLNEGELLSLNAQIMRRERLHRDGTAAQDPVLGAVGTASRGCIYRVTDDILWLLPDAALVPSAEIRPPSLGVEKRIVQSFYDEFGWVESESGLFNDTTEFTDSRPLATAYRRVCNARIGRHLPGGTSILDVASGAIPHDEYLDYSRDYRVRICVDFSIRALREAKKKLGEKGLFVLGDITRLPLASDSIDAVISLHTVYHVPKTEQTCAIDELMRVCKPGGRVIVVYTWSASPAMDLIFGLRGFLGRVRRLGRPSPVAAPRSSVPAGDSGKPKLFFCPQSYEWYRRELVPRYPVSLAVWSAVSSAFQVRFAPENLFGRSILRAVRMLEDLCPGLAGRYGQYPMFLFEKPKDGWRGE